MTKEDLSRIEKEAEEYAKSDPCWAVGPHERRMAASSYIAGATAENERLQKEISALKTLLRMSIGCISQ